MANFASESDVRLALQVNDAVAVPSALAEASIAAAHDALLRRIDPALEGGVPPSAVVRGEAFLAGAYLLRSLAAKDAVEQKHLAIGSQRIEAGARHLALTVMADMLEEEAWKTLAPYVKDCAGREAAAATDSTAVLGGRRPWPLRWER